MRRTQYFSINDVPTKGFVSFSSIFFYSFSILILLAIPVTILLVKNEQEQVTQASNTFSKTPIFSVTPQTTEVKRGEMVQVSTSMSFANWYAVYFFTSDYLPTDALDILNTMTSRFETPDNIIKINEGAQPTTFTFSPPKNGYVLGMGYQLSNYFGEFKAGDIGCGWDNYMYLYKRKTNVFDELLKKEGPRGHWEKLIPCENSGPVKISVL